MNGSRRLLALLLIGLYLEITFLGSRHLWFTGAETATVELPPMNLTVVGANGTGIVLNETGIAALPFYTGYGAYKNQIGNLKGFGSYTGVALETLCNLVGGLTNTSIVKVVAVDDYSMNFTYTEVRGEFVTYDNVTGAEVPHSQPLVPIAAYYLNGTEISSSDGPLRIAIVSPEGFATTSGYWVKQVIRIEIIENVVPELSPSIFLSLFFLMTLAAVLVLKVRRQRGNCLI
jgi:hypothetical protein